MAASLKMQGEKLDESSKAFIGKLWLETLTTIGEQRFEAALNQVMRESPYFPDISLIRRAAGIKTAEQEIEAEALEQFKLICTHMRVNGPKLVKVHGAWIGEYPNRQRDNHEPHIPAPTFSEATEGAIIEMGFGSREAGLDAISEHPGVCTKPTQPRTEVPTTSFRTKIAQDIEVRWLKAYMAAIGPLRSRRADSHARRT